MSRFNAKVRGNKAQEVRVGNGRNIKILEMTLNLLCSRQVTRD